MNLRVHDAAELLDVSDDTVRRWSDAGVLPVRRLPSGHRRFDAGEVLRLKRRIDTGDATAAPVEEAAQ